MRRKKIYFIDEDAAARRANVRSLTALLDTKELEIEALEPRRDFSAYTDLLASPETAAFVLDQRMKGSGIVNYNGTDLARYLRGLDGKMPIYILTGHAQEIQDFAGAEHLVEYIIGKDEIEDAESEGAKIVKARLLRHLNVFNDIRDEQEQDFHDLLIKSLREPLTKDEQGKMDRIEGITTAPVLAAERQREKALAQKIEKLRSILNIGDLPLK